MLVRLAHHLKTKVSVMFPYLTPEQAWQLLINAPQYNFQFLYDLEVLTRYISRLQPPLAAHDEHPV